MLIEKITFILSNSEIKIIYSYLNILKLQKKSNPSLIDDVTTKEQ